MSALRYAVLVLLVAVTALAGRVAWIAHAGPPRSESRAAEDGAPAPWIAAQEGRRAEAASRRARPRPQKSTSQAGALAGAPDAAMLPGDASELAGAVEGPQPTDGGAEQDERTQSGPDAAVQGQEGGLDAGSEIPDGGPPTEPEAEEGPGDERNVERAEAWREIYGIGPGSTGYGMGPRSTGYGIGPGSTGFGLEEDEIPYGIGPGSTGIGLEEGVDPYGIGPGSTGIGLEEGVDPYGTGAGSTAYGIGPGSTGYGIGPGSTGYGIGPGSTGYGLERQEAAR